MKIEKQVIDIKKPFWPRYSKKKNKKYIYTEIHRAWSYYWFQALRYPWVAIQIKDKSLQRRS